MAGLVATPSLRLALTLTAPSALAVSVAAASAALRLAALPRSCRPAVKTSASCRPRSVALLVVSVSVSVWSVSGSVALMKPRPRRSPVANVCAATVAKVGGVFGLRALGSG